MASFVPNPSGFVEVCKSAGMRSMLLEAAERVCGRANQIAYANPKTVHINAWKVPPYTARVDSLTYTAVGAIYIRSKLGRRFEQKRKALAGQNH